MGAKLASDDLSEFVIYEQVVWWAMRYLGVDDWIASVIKAMYEDALSKVK